MAVLRRILGVTRRNRRRNNDVRKDLGVSRDIVNEIRQRRLAYFGHIVRMELSRSPNILLYGQVHGSRPRGRPRKRWMDGVRDDCRNIGITLEEAEHMARDRRLWSRTVYRLLERHDQSAAAMSPMH